MMIKRLLFVAALMAPGLAYGDNDRFLSLTRLLGRVGGGQPAVFTLPSGSYHISNGASSFDYGCTVHSFNTTNTGVGQQFTWDGLHLISIGVTPPACSNNIQDNGDGTIGPGTTNNTWTATSSGPGWIFRNINTANYLAVAGSDVVVSPTVQTVWSLPVLPTPTAQTFSPTSCSLADTVSSGTLCASDTVTMSDSSVFWGKVTSSNTDLFSVPLVSGSPGPANISTARAMSSADDGGHTTSITACSGGSCISSNLTMTVTAGGGTPPTAAAAGFTTLAINFDFSQPQYATQSNWLDCNRNDPTKTWHYASPFSPTSDFAPCNINQAIDPVTGQTVLNVQWLSSYFNAQPQNVLLMTTTLDSTHYLDYPNFYVEFVARISNKSATGSAYGLADVWSGQDINGSYPNTNIELDYVELPSNPSLGADAAVHNWAGGGVSGNPSYFLYSGSSNNYPPGYIETSYHKYGYLFTSDGATASYACAFIDDINQGCGSVGALSSPNQYLWRNYLIISNSTNDGNISDMAQYIQYVRVWSCANWALPAGNTSTPANMCNGSTLFSGTQDGQSLIYWH